ncbi:MAG: hypothetical protein P4L50_06085 [Anaerolineaceae bacterium]|nr:hypothetical protein [Anaerolineaceae bacterium]
MALREDPVIFQVDEAISTQARKSLYLKISLLAGIPLKIAPIFAFVLLIGLLVGCANPNQSSAASSTATPLAAPSAASLVSPAAVLPTLAPSPAAAQSSGSRPTPPPATRPPAQPKAPVPSLPAPTAPLVSPTARPTLAPDAWQNLPVIPTVSDTARAIYARGQKAGNNPDAFSKVGDCESRTQWFLTDFDKIPPTYTLGPYTDLQPVIEYFKGSYARMSVASLPGFTAASVLTPLWADPKQCNRSETPLSCEYRLHRPSFALIMLGTNDVPHIDKFEPNMRTIIEFTIDQGIVPILVTKADNLEGDKRINATIAELANEYDIPLWNFWRAVQGLPNGGLQSDNAHLTFGTNNFANAASLQSAWPVRNLTALQTLDAVWRGVTETK